MITFVLIAFILLFTMAGILIAMQAKKRKDGKEERPSQATVSAPPVGRATGRGDN